MAKPEKRWQLLLVADDGRIIPFKRVKGMLLALLILLIVLALFCAGLAWQLTAEKVRHHRTSLQLADASRQMVDYKSKHELIAAELVLAEARMEKAGLPVPRRTARIPRQAPGKTADGTNGDGGKKPASEIAAGPMVTDSAVEKAAATTVPDPVQAIAPEKKKAPAPPEPEKPAVEIGDLEVTHDAAKKILLARFRVKNTGPRSSPVAGRCVVVLKNDLADAATWLGMPGVTLVDGKPDGKRGQAFKISRFRDMEIKAAGQADPSAFKHAAVYVFDTSGRLISTKDFTINLPAPKPEPEPAPEPEPKPAAEPAPPASPPEAVQPPAPPEPAASPAPGGDSGPAPGKGPAAAIPDAAAGAALPSGPAAVPVDDPSLTDPVEPVKEEDTRSRF
ncbi:hypothetical protein DSCA_63650 [Desulfosarcina alkanivorans]|uniref:Uncharacterized protein n=1 Tax=Desulfosarcina alkanivorans TaxID=571177 RepID=A0A5K7YVJ8_9BACT|nr:hypothetical protein [Desulfosarcina alkanivorans]BBO72435.1 hypothetical protein DSCA_63650 [Desulfosarcina alkanivorans]